MKYIKATLSLAKKITPILPISKFMASISRRISYFAHWFQFMVEWGSDNPEYFNHHLDLNYLWRKTGNSLPMERGVHSSIALEGGDTLDLACGDGFFTNYFYALKSNRVVGVDFDPSAIKLARKNKIRGNVDFILGDIRTDIPDGPFDNVVWDAAIEHFTEVEIADLVAKIKSVLNKDGILSGYTVTEAPGDAKHLHQHEYEFHNKEDLARFLEPHFKNVHVYETVFPNRTNLYFYATDGRLPHERQRHLIVKR
jgi:SAM-dependent methyltransferase